MLSDKSKTIGFIGIGTLATALVKGLCTLDATQMPFKLPLALTQRGAKNSQSLLDEFGAEHISVFATALQVAAISDVVIICVRVQDFDAILEELRPALKDKILLSCAASIPCVDVARMAQVSVSSVVKVVPLPASAIHLGTTLITPPNAIAKDIFATLGYVHEVETEELMAPLVAAGALMGHHFESLRITRNYLSKKGIDSRVASEYLSSLFGGWSAEIAHVAGDAQGLDSLVNSMTAGGLNERTIAHLRKDGVYDSVENGLDNLIQDMKN